MVLTALKLQNFKSVWEVVCCAFYFAAVHLIKKKIISVFSFAFNILKTLTISSLRICSIEWVHYYSLNVFSPPLVEK